MNYTVIVSLYINIFQEKIYLKTVRVEFATSGWPYAAAFYAVDVTPLTS